MKQRFMSVLLASILCLSLLVGCGNGDSDQEASTQTEDRAEGQQEVNGEGSNEETFGNPEAKDGEIVVAYFAVAENSEVDAVSSASVVTIDGEAKGTIKALADMIQSRTGGELFSIQTSVEYPAGRDELIEYAEREQDEDARPELTSHMDRFQEAEIIFIGYPKLVQGF